MNKKLALVFCWLTLFLHSSYGAAADGYRIIQLDAAPLSIAINRPGQADFRHLTTLSFQSAGYIEQLELDEGDRVSRGKVIASLDTSILKANLASAKADYVDAVSDLKRAKRLFEQKTVSENDLENAQTLLKTSQAQLEVARFNLRKAQIKAPFDGIIIDRLAQTGELVNVGSPVYQVARGDSDMVVRLALTQDEIVQVTEQQPVTVQTGTGQTIQARIDRIATRADPVTGMYEVEIPLPTGKSAIRAGLWLDLHLQLQAEQRVFQIPLKALLRINQDRAQFMVEEDGMLSAVSAPVLHFDKQAVYVAAESDSLTLVVEGWSAQALEAKLKGH